MTKENLVTAPVAPRWSRRRKSCGGPAMKTAHRGRGGRKGPYHPQKDMRKRGKYPLSARDKDGRRCYAAAIGATSGRAGPAAALVNAQAGRPGAGFRPRPQPEHPAGRFRVKAAFPHISLIAGNIATAEAAEALMMPAPTPSRWGLARIHLHDRWWRASASPDHCSL